MTDKPYNLGDSLLEGLNEALAWKRGHSAPEGFTLREVEIGDHFRSGGGAFRCTDKGSRTIAAIRVDEVTVASSGGETRVLSYDEASRDGWFNGPPYAVAEVVFDEDDLEGCDLTTWPRAEK